MGKEWACEICGREALPMEPAACSNGIEIPSDRAELSTFSMGVYAIRVCSVCREKLGEDALREKLREKVRRSQAARGG
ncbi:MAG: hypothetical protein FJZ95_06320 [Chloroflexi bacterium]|nr:hypothetical protein [Chloroflexota bacterium]